MKAAYSYNYIEEDREPLLQMSKADIDPYYSVRE